MNHLTDQPIGTGRHDDPTILFCSCGWIGPRSEAIHDYKPVPPDDCECMDYCPHCKAEI